MSAPACIDCGSFRISRHLVPQNGIHIKVSNNILVKFTRWSLWHQVTLPVSLLFVVKVVQVVILYLSLSYNIFVCLYIHYVYFFQVDLTKTPYLYLPSNISVSILILFSCVIYVSLSSIYTSISHVINLCLGYIYHISIIYLEYKVY